MSQKNAKDSVLDMIREEGKDKPSVHDRLGDDVDKNSNSTNKSNSKKKSALDQLKADKPKSETHTFKGYYLENGVADKIDSLTDHLGKGAKSKFVNEVLREYLIENNLM